jgi:endonuclease YncB( thermonuclease family)
MRYVIALLAGMALAQLPVFPPERGTYLVYLARAIDGDTVEFYWCVKDSGRLGGINAPEPHGASKEAGLAAKAELERIAPPGFYQIDAQGREKYGRLMVTIHDKLGTTINKRMLDSGLVKPWDGRGPRP